MVKPSMRVAVAGLLALGGCQKPVPPTMTKGPLNVIDPWVLATEDATAPTPALLWNGQIGFRIGRNGSPVLPDGTALPAFSQDSFEAGGEERIIPLDKWYDSREAPPPFQAGLSSKYRQELDMRTGILRTSWINLDKGRRVIVERETVIDPFGNPVWGERWSMKAASINELNKGRDNYIKDEFDQTHYLPPNLDNGNPPGDTFEEIVNRSKDFWTGFWQTDIEIDGPVEDQQAIRSFLFYLRTAINPENERAISPMALSSRQYFGHVFWDADVWVFPALALLDPDRAATIPLYRLSKVKGARQNYLNWVKAGRPIGKGDPLGTGEPDPDAIMFPWESSSTGLETVPGDSKYQHHISGTVLFGLQHASALGLVPNTAVQKVEKAVGQFYMDRALRGSDGFWSIQGTMSPDEHHTGDNDLYTNILANRATSGPDPQNALFQLPRDDQSFLTYDNDPIRSYKQAAAVLAIYPLQFTEAEKQAKVMMDRFADKVIKNGPAMSDSVHATIWARLGDTERAYATWRKSWQDFTQHPLLLFSEKRSKDVTYFTTGAGGCLQSVLYGFAGLRIDDHKPEKAAWMVPLKEGYWLSCTPHLPKAWRSVKIKRLRVLDDTYDLTIEGSQVRAERSKR